MPTKKLIGAPVTGPMADKYKAAAKKAQIQAGVKKHYGAAYTKANGPNNVAPTKGKGPAKLPPGAPKPKGWSPSTKTKPGPSVKPGAYKKGK